MPDSIFPFGQSLFTLVKDLPYDGRVTVETIDENDIPKGAIAHVSSVSYGRVGLLVVESNYNLRKVRAAVNIVASGRNAELTDENRAVLADMEAYHIWFSANGELKMVAGAEEAIHAYTRPRTTFDDVFPCCFTLDNYFTNGVQLATYHLVLP